MSDNQQTTEIGLTMQSPNKNYNPMNSSIQFIPELTLENLTEQVPFPQKETIKQDKLQNQYSLLQSQYKMIQLFQDIKRKKIIGCNIYVNEMNAQQLQLSKLGRQCRICMGDEETSRFISPCACKGTLIFVHEECLKLWILQKNGIEEVFKDKIKCELCSYRFRMTLQVVNRILGSIFKLFILTLPSQQKICWLIYLLIIIALIGGLVALFLEYQLSNIGVDAVMTLMIVLSLIFFVYFLASILQSLQIEMIENWTIYPYKPRRITKQGSFFQLQSHMGNSVSVSPSARKRTVHLLTCPPQIASLQVIQINQLMTSANLSEQ